MRRGQAVAAVDPEPVGDHPLPQRLDADLEAVTLGQLLRRQCRAEVNVSLPDQRQRRPAEALYPSARDRLRLSRMVP